MIRCLIVDDSPTFRAALRLTLEERPGIAIVGEASDGEEAIRLALELRPDVITMDLRMPRRDGIEATREIMRLSPTRVLVLSADRDLAMGLRALEAGALDVLAKPRGGGVGGFAAQAAETRAAIESVVGRPGHPGDAPRAPRSPRAPDPADAPDAPRAATRAGPHLPPRIVGLGASTGGPNALARVLGALPHPFPVPILITQHLADGFHAGLADWLAKATGQAVKVAQDGERLRCGAVYLAPQDRHLGACHERIVLSAGAPVDGFRPSVSALFSSLAEAFGDAAAGVILTGMGRDGAAGLKALREAGGFTAAQGPATSVVFGMPEVALRTGAASVPLELEEIPPALVHLVGDGAGGLLARPR
jgi:two-component system chemotaxis response regulator CheB